MRGKLEKGMQIEHELAYSLNKRIPPPNPISNTNKKDKIEQEEGDGAKKKRPAAKQKQKMYFSTLGD